MTKASDDLAPVLVLDVNETLLDITTLEPVFARLFGDAAMMREWFAQLILYSQTMTLSGRYTPFGELAVGALRMLADIHGQSVSNSDVDDLKRHLGAMPAHSDALPALSRLRDAGFRLVTLTNSAPSPAPSALERAGLRELFENTFSVEAVQRVQTRSGNLPVRRDGTGCSNIRSLPRCLPSVGHDRRPGSRLPGCSRLAATQCIDACSGSSTTGLRVTGSA